MDMTTKTFRFGNKTAVRIIAAEFCARVPTKKETGRRTRFMKNNVIVAKLFASILIFGGFDFERERCWEAQAFTKEWLSLAFTQKRAQVAHRSSLIHK